MSAARPVSARDADGALAEALLQTGLITDPWVDGRPRFSPQPLRLTAATADGLATAAEQIAAAYHEAMLITLEEPALLDDVLALTPVQRLLWQSSAPLWHGVARADVFLVDDAPEPRAVVCEINADTPSGQPEAVLLGPASGVPAAHDPNRDLEARFGDLLGHFLATVDRDPTATPTVGIVYPTEIAGDFALIRLYQRWCQALGLRVMLGSPFNLQPASGGRVALFGTPCDLILRHYKTDWWGERLPLWSDEDPYPDAEPLAAPLRALLQANLNDRCAILNPFGSVLAQNKRTMALLFERRALLSPGARTAVEAHLPFTMRLETADQRQLAAEQADWVLKSDYGCEGEEVILGNAVSTDEWRDCLARALPRRWVVQRYFQAQRSSAGVAVNHGIYLIGGRRAGIYARLSSGATDASALSTAVEVIG